MVGNLGSAEAFGFIVMMLLAWSVPIALSVWFVRTLMAMVSAQRDIANHLGDIKEHLREGGRAPIA